MAEKSWKEDNTLLKLKENKYHKNNYNKNNYGKHTIDKIPWGNFTINKYGDTVLPDYLDGESYEL